tara:strand:+ start:996 stop:1262 length:267 start_codon:yes stop_codon:yes gene_type:complete
MAGKTKAQREAEALKAKAVELSGMSADEFDALSDEEKASWDDKAKDAIAADAEKLDESHLVEVKKGDEVLKVHPSCLADHKRIGWVEA